MTNVVPSWMLKEEQNREETKKISLRKEDSKKITAKPKNNDNHARQDVQESAPGEKCVVGPVLIRDKIHKLKFKEAISSVDKCTTEDLH